MSWARFGAGLDEMPMPYQGVHQHLGLEVGAAFNKIDRARRDPAQRARLEEVKAEARRELLAKVEEMQRGLVQSGGGKHSWNGPYEMGVIVPEPVPGENRVALAVKQASQSGFSSPEEAMAAVREAILSGKVV